MTIPLITLHFVMEHKRDIKICRATLRILKYSLIWPNEDEEMNPTKWYYIRVVTFLLVTSLWVVAVLTHLIVAVKDGLDVPLIEDFAFLVAFSGLYFITFIYVKNQPKVAGLLKDLSDFRKFGKPPGFDRVEATLSFWSKWCYVYTVLGVLGYNVFKLLQKSECERLNAEKGWKEHCGILTAVWVPFDMDYFPVFHLVFFYVFVCSQILMKLSLMISFNCLEMAHHIILRIDHLNVIIAECFDGEDLDACRKRLRKCISYHSDILNLSSRLDACFSDGMFAHLTITAAICGCLEKQFADGINKLGSLIHMAGWIMALFVACLGGQHLITAGASIPQAIWSSKWYQVDRELRKDLLFMLARSQRSLHVSAGSFRLLSFPLLVSVLKMSYSILAMLKS